MNRPRCKRRYGFRPSLVLLLPCCAMLLSGCVRPAFAAELELRSFEASYDLFSDGLHVGTTEMKLEPAGKRWRYSTTTRARGVYSLFTSKQPHTETLFSLARGEVLLHQITVADKGTDRQHEVARFDWRKGRLEVSRKGKHRRLELRAGGGVHDYQSIHLLAASMAGRRLDRATIDFYRRGKLVKSRLVFDGRRRIEVDGKSTEALVFEQRIVRSDASIRYFYDPRQPLLPLRVERHEAGERPSVLELRKVEWRL